MTNTQKGILEYYAGALPSDVEIISIVFYGFGAILSLEYQEKRYASLYLYHSLRQQGNYRNLYFHYLSDMTIITKPDCNLESYCKKWNIPVLCLPE